MLPDLPVHTETLFDNVSSSLRHVQGRIDAALNGAGRAADAARLVAVSKTHPQEAIVAALQAGQRLFGENRVQEAGMKFPPLRETWPDLQLHLIGPLQTNKARDAVRFADVIETVDRARLVDAIADAVQREGRTPVLLVQVNVGDEGQKAGISRVETDAFIELCLGRFGAAVPLAEDVDACIAAFC